MRFALPSAVGEEKQGEQCCWALRGSGPALVLGCRFTEGILMWACGWPHTYRTRKEFREEN